MCMYCTEMKHYNIVVEGEKILFDALQNRIIKMTVTTHTYFFFVLMHIISICHSQQTTSVSASRFGASSCYVKGGYVEHCFEQFALISQFPKECSSFYMDYLVVNMDRDVNGYFGKSTKSVMNELIDTGKPVYVAYAYLSIDDFFSTLESDPSNQINITKEIKSLQAYLGQNKTIAGLSVTLDFTPDVSLPINFSQKLRLYLETLKKSLPNNMEIGLGFPAIYFRDSVDCLIEFQVFNEAVNYYVIFSYALNDDCPPGLKSGGQTPVNGGANYTLEKLQWNLNNAGIDSSKLQYLFITYPSNSTNGDVCSMNYYESCKHPDLATEWCADTLESFYEKGKFVKQCANGFISGHVDLDDPRCKCKCGHPFPAFYAILNGFNGGPPPAKCSLFDRM